ncbi:uncharacterized protein BJ212DRAFT_1382487, partial [Suillus subaureus]
GSSVGIRRWRITIVVVVLGSGGRMLGFVAENDLCSFVGGEKKSGCRQADRVYNEASRSLLCFSSGHDLSDLVDNNPFEARDLKEASDSDASSNSNRLIVEEITVTERDEDRKDIAGTTRRRG